MDTINKTGIPTRNKGERLSSSDFNTINGTLNQVVDAVNPMLTSKINLNAETGNLNKMYTKEEAILAVPNSRRQKGLTLRYYTKPGYFDEITFLGDSIEDWDDLDYWGMGGNIIDGGEW